MSTVARDEPLLVVRGVRKAYRSGEEEVPVLSGLDLELGRGSMTSLMGVSGSGKSTLISVIAGLLVADEGDVRFDGQDLGALDDRGRAELRARRIGVVMQSGNLIPFLTAEENVQLAKDLAGGMGTSLAPAELLEKLGVGRRRDHMPRRLSGGEAQRVGVALALINEPRLLLGDEITGELDIATSETVMELVVRLQRERGLAVLVVTHNLSVAAMADRKLTIADGVVRPA